MADLDPNRRDLITYGGFSGRPGQASSQVGEVNRMRQMGSSMGGREAYQNDYRLSDASRAQQQGALGLARDAAMGNAPSRAELLGQRMIDDSIDASMAVAGGARGGALAQASALGAAQRAGAVTRQAGTRDLAAMRADEMARARDAYMAGATGMRGQDLSQAGMQAENERFQRGLNQTGQLAMEGMAHDVNKTQAMINMQQLAEEGANARNQSQVNQHSQDRETGFIGGLIGGAAGAAGGLLGKISDPRAKEPMGTLGPSPLSYAAGPQPAPSGYAASRAGQDGYMFGPEPGAPSPSSSMGGAPGADDWTRFGAPGAADMRATMAAPGSAAAQTSGVDWTNGGTTGAPAGGPDGGGVLGAIGAGFSGFAGQPAQGAPAAGAPGGGALGALGAGFSGFAGAMKTSDPMTKTAMSPMSGPASTAWGGAFHSGTEQLSGGGMDPMAGIKWNNAEIGGMVSDPSGGMLKVSDNRAKLAEAWDQGHAAAIADVEKASRMSPDELKRRSEGDDYHPAAAAARSIKSRAWDEGDASGRTAGYGQATRDQMTAQLAEDDRKRGIRQPTSFTRDKRADELQSAPPAQMMDAIGPGKAFRYKPGVPGEDPSRPQFGTTTQDLKQTPMGASMVAPHPSGFDAIDVREAVGPTLASLGNLNQRVRLLEGKKGGR